MSFLDASAKLARLKSNEEHFAKLVIKLNEIEQVTSPHFPHWRESILNFQVSQWIEAFQTNNNVKHVTVDLGNGDPATLWDERKVSRFVEAIGSLPTLERLELVQFKPRHMASLPAITNAIRNSRCLRHLAIHGDFNIQRQQPDSEVYEYLQAMVRAIQSHPQLKYLSIVSAAHLGVDWRHAGALLPTILQNESISELQLGQVSEEFFPLVEGLASNRTLETLKLTFTQQLDDALCEKLAEALQVNRHLRSLGLVKTRSRMRPYDPRYNVSGISEKGYQALTRMMEHNYHIQEFKTTGNPGANADIEFYTKLNRAGRLKLIQGSASNSHKDWVDVLVALQGEVECIFYVLMLNPSLFADVASFY